MPFAAEPEERRESMHPGKGDGMMLSEEVVIRQYAGEGCGARGFSTGTASFLPGALLAYHTHRFSEVAVVLEGQAHVEVEGRGYLLQRYDCIHVPADTAHQAKNPSADEPALVLWAFPSTTPSRELVNSTFAGQDRGLENPADSDPEGIIRFSQAETYELSPGAHFRDLFASRYGVTGICGGYGRFQPGSSLPCHIHVCDESITIVEGEADCLVQGKGYRLSGYDTACVPEGRPHRFLNRSTGPMAMIWVYASSEPERTLVEASYCDGTLGWPGSKAAKKLLE